jgi:hypothetical protein
MMYPTISNRRPRTKIQCPHSRRLFRPRVDALEPRLAPANVDVLSYHNDLSLTGQNLQEEILTPANVNPTTFGKLFSDPVDGYVYAEPLYKANLLIPGQGTHNVAFVATEHDSVYAFDTDNPASGLGPEGSLWKVSFIDPANGITSVPSGDVGVVSTNIVPEIGITGTPVIDGATGTLYVVAKTKEVRADGAHYVQKLHALDIATGHEKFGGPATIGDTMGTNTNTSPVSVPGGGDGSINGVVTFNARKELQRPALQLVNGVVYIGWASHEDDRPYHGWIVGYNAGNLAAGPVKVFNTAPNAGGVGLWQSGGAISADLQGNLYFALGNGFDGPDPGFDPTHGNYSESVLKLSTTGQLSVADYFTPFDWRTLDNQDADLGSGGAMLLPDFVGSTAHPHLMVETGKSGKIYLIDRDSMGRINNPGIGPDLVVQTVTAGQAGIWGNPAFARINATTGIIYYHGQGDFLKGYYITNGHIDDTPADILHSNFRSGYPGAQPVVSANGIANPTNPTNAIVWELQVDAANPSDDPRSASILRAFRTTDLSTELYDSSQTSLRDLPGSAVKFTVPTVTNGHVLVGARYSFSVFGLFPTATSVPAARTNLQGMAQADSRGTQIQLTWINPAPNPGAAPTGIKVLRSTDGTTFTQVATVSARAASFTDQGPFVTGQHYFYRVVATNQLGDSGPSNTVDIVAPIQSAALTIVSVTSSSLGLSWTNVANDHYDVERSSDGINFTHVATVHAPQTTYTDTGLAPGIYAYRVHAFNVSPASDSLSNVGGATVGGVIDHNTGFSNTTDLTANGDARFGNNVVRLTGADLQTGSFFTNTPLTIGRFDTTFVVRLSEGTQPNYADGFVFVIQANAPTAIGQGLGGLGYQGIGNSVGVKFGSFQYPVDPAISSTGLVVNGAAPRGGVATGMVLLNSQNPKRIHLTYDGTTLNETITDTLTGTSFTTSYTVNIPQLIGSDSAYVGFTGSTGSPGPTSFWQLQDIGSWIFTSQAPLPGAPSNLRVAATTASTVTLSWTGNSYNETGFRIDRSSDGATFAPAGTTSATTFTDTGLAHGTYYYRVLAFNINGNSDFTNIVIATLPASDPAPAITSVTRSSRTIKPNGTLALSVAFADPDANDPHTAVVSWGDGSSPTTQPLAAGILQFNVSHQYAAGVSGTNYAIQVKVQDDDGGTDTVNLTATAGSAAVPAGLVDWWTGDGYNPTTAADIVGTHPGTLIGGVSYLPGKVGNAFAFNGTTSYVKLPDNSIPFPTGGTANAPLAFTAWFKTTTGGVILGQQGGPAFGNPAGWVPGVYVGTDGKLRVQMFWNGGVSPATSPSPVNDGLFHFLAVSSDGQTESAYLDNQLIGTTSALQVAYNTSYSYQIGTGYTAGQWPAATGGWYSFKGLIDEVQVFNTPLAPSAIQAIYNAGSAGQVKGVTVFELPPAVTSVTRSAFSINENNTLTLNGAFTEPQPGDPHQATITWGDGSPPTMLNLNATTFNFSASHQYVDEPSSGNNYAIQVTVQDVAGGTDTVDLTSTSSAIASPAGLVSWWTGDGTSTTAAPDIAGTNGGSISGGITHAPGEVGNAFRFDGGNASFVNVPNAASLNITTGATWDLWVRSAQSGSYVGFMGKHDAMTSLNGVTIYMDPTGLPSVQIKGTTPDQTVTLTGTTRVNDDHFHHLALTYQSGGAMILYVDGQQQASATAPVFSFNPNPLRLGRLFDPFWAPLNGLLDEAQILNRVLTATEIQAIFNAGSAGQIKGVTVADPAVTPTGGFTVNAVVGVPSRMQTVATFTDPAGAEAPRDYSATIDWGDNMSSDGVLSGPVAGVFTIQGSHSYAQPGNYSVTVRIHHDSAADAMATSSANVAALQLHLLVSGFPSPVVAGTQGMVTVAAQDQLGETVPSYRGIIHFTSRDMQAMLPDDYTFAASDNGTHTFTATLRTAGTQSITATDTAMSSLTGTQDGIVVDPDIAVRLVVADYPSPVIAGTNNRFDATAFDVYGNIATGYRGTIHFTSSDPQAALDPDYTFQAVDNGMAFFGAILFTAGVQSITATDTVNTTITGTQNGIVVNTAPLNGFAVTGFPSPVTAGSPNLFQVRAIDAYNNTIVDYTGTVHFTTSDPVGQVPLDYTFIAGDNGMHEFGAILKTAGLQSITATDTANSSITGTQDGIMVVPGPARSFVVEGFPSPITAGSVGTFTVTAYDLYGNVATNYTGVVHFTSTDMAAELPPDYTFTPSDQGTHQFAAALHTPGTWSMTATDTTDDSVTGTQDNIVVNPPPTVTSGASFATLAISPAPVYTTPSVVTANPGGSSQVSTPSPRMDDLDRFFAALPRNPTMSEPWALTHASLLEGRHPSIDDVLFTESMASEA